MRGCRCWRRWCRLVAGPALAKLLARLANQRPKPFAALPEPLDISRIAHVALVAGGVHHALVLALDVALPTLEHQLLHGLDVQDAAKAVAYGAYYLAVLQRMCPVDEDAAEELHVEAPVERLYQPVV